MKIADSKRLYEIKKSLFDGEINSKKADAELAYKLQEAKENQKIRFAFDYITSFGWEFLFG